MARLSAVAVGEEVRKGETCEGIVLQRLREDCGNVWVLDNEGSLDTLIPRYEILLRPPPSTRFAGLATIELSTIVIGRKKLCI